MAAILSAPDTVATGGDAPRRGSGPVVPLEGGLNFRDLGGIAGAEGRRVRRGLVYRSGTMHALTAADQARLAALGIRTVIDLRSNHERGHSPLARTADWPATYWSRDYLHSSADLQALLRKGDVARDETRTMMLGLYRTLAYDHAESFATLFRHLAAGDVPLVFNCAAGKDRTGAAAILLLDALGVSREDILADYLATNGVADAIWAKLAKRFVRGGAREHWSPVFTCDADYVRVLIETLEADHGSLAGYRAAVLGFGAADEARLRDGLLEDAA